MIAALGSWEEGVRTFLGNANEKCLEPWHMSYEDRRRMTREPRVLRQLELEDEWRRTCMEGIWAGMRRFSRPIEDYRVSEARFYEYLTSVGVCSGFLKNKLFSIFRSAKYPEVDCLRACKAIHMGLTGENTSLNFIEHCYRSLPISTVSGEVEYTVLVQACELQQGSNEKKTAVDLRLQQLDGVLQYLKETKKTTLSLPTFHTLFFEIERRHWASSFIKPILEAAAKYFATPYGVFPTIPLRWLKTTEPLPYDRNVLHDADSLLLQNIELTGRENSEGKDKGQKRRRRRPFKKVQ